MLAETIPPPPSPTTKGIYQVRVLLIEDNPGDVLLIRQVFLTASPNAEVRVAVDGELALRVLADREFVPDLIILDLNIPRIPGLTLLKQCQPPAPVVVFSFFIESGRDPACEGVRHTGIRSETDRLR